MNRNKSQALELDEAFDASDVWLVPKNGRVVIDERGNSVWQWPSANDPFAAEHDRLQDMDAADLCVVEPGEIRRSRLPWVHDSERPAKEFRTPKTDKGKATRSRLR